MYERMDASFIFVTFTALSVTALRLNVQFVRVSDLKSNYISAEIGYEENQK